jgi:glycosyltransferase involved in cell wall biosynthesis
MKLRPKVSIMLLTYNHERYVAQALESILMQKTEYSYEINVIEDCSTDQTQQVVMQYVRKYPSIVIPYFNSKNIGRKVPQRNFFRGFKTLSGEYFALLEGDDYWTSPDKIQKQVNFLEANPDFSLCAHNTVKIYDYDGDSRQPHRFLYQGKRRDGTIDDVIHLDSFFHTTGVMYRNIFNGVPPRHYRSRWCGDVFIMLSHAQYGKLHHLDEDMAVYRAHAGGWFSNRPLLEQRLMSVNGLRRYNAWLGYRYLKPFSGSIARCCNVLLKQCGKGDVAPLTLHQRIKYCYLWLLYRAVHCFLNLPHEIRTAVSRQALALLHKGQAQHGRFEDAVVLNRSFRSFYSRLRSRLLLLLDSSFSGPAASKSALKILSFGPRPVTRCEPFNVQPDGSSAMWMRLDGDVGARASIIFDGKALTTVVQGSIVTATVPLHLVTTAGPKPVWLEVRVPGGVENSDPVLFEVKIEKRR